MHLACTGQVPRRCRAPAELRASGERDWSSVQKNPHKSKISGLGSVTDSLKATQERRLTMRPSEGPPVGHRRGQGSRAGGPGTIHPVLGEGDTRHPATLVTRDWPLQETCSGSGATCCRTTSVHSCAGTAVLSVASRQSWLCDCDCFHSLGQRGNNGSIRGCSTYRTVSNSPHLL